MTWEDGECALEFTRLPHTYICHAMQLLLPSPDLRGVAGSGTQSIVSRRLFCFFFLRLKKEELLLSSISKSYTILTSLSITTKNKKISIITKKIALHAFRKNNATFNSGLWGQLRPRLLKFRACGGQLRLRYLKIRGLWGELPPFTVICDRAFSTDSAAHW